MSGVSPAPPAHAPTRTHAIPGDATPAAAAGADASVEAVFAAADPAERWWLGLLQAFPFVFLPLVAALGILCSIVMPFLTGVAGR